MAEIDEGKGDKGASMQWVTWRRVWAGCLATAVILHTVAFAIAKPGFVFSGFLLNSIDPWGYMGFSRCFASGGFLIDNPFAPSAAKPAFFNLLWFLVGKVQALLGLGFLPVYYAVGVAASGLMFAALWAFSREFLGDGPRARLAFMLAVVGGGLGWIQALLSESLTKRFQPIDLFHHEGFPLLSALFFPHFALSTGLLVTILLWFHRGVSIGGKKWTLGAAALFLCLGFFHPYHMVTVAVGAGAWIVTEQAIAGRRRFHGWLHLAMLGAAGLPPLLYYLWFFNQPNWIMWSGKCNEIPSTAMGVLLGLGPLLLLAMAGLLRGGRRNLARFRFPLTWSLVGLGLVFSSPVIKFEGKLVEGLTVPLAVLGAVGFFGQEDRCGRGCRRGAILLVLFLLPSTILLAAKSLQVVHGEWWENFFPTNWSLGAYMYEGDLAVMRRLEKKPLRGAVVIAPYEQGLILPGMSDTRVFVSGPCVTPGYAWRYRAAERYYTAKLSSMERYALLKSVGVTHVWSSPMWVIPFEVEKEPYLEPALVSGGAGIWRIIP